MRSIMKNISKTVVFFGSGPVAAKGLALLSQHTSVEAIVTKPTTLKQMRTVAPNIPIYTAANKKDLTQLVLNEQFKSDVAVLIDFGIIVEQAVIDSFYLGIVNSHFSLLPRLRGADPITFTILNGDEKTGVSLMLIDAGLDTGKLITQKTMAVSPTSTTPELTADLIELSNQLIKDYLPLYVSGEVKPRQQPHPDRATYTRKLTKQDGLIDWNKPAKQIEREIRAYIDWPRSTTRLANKDVIITKAHATSSSHPNEAPGSLRIINKSNSLYVATSEGKLWIEKLQPAGKTEMTVAAFLAGYRSKLNSH